MKKLNVAKGRLVVLLAVAVLISASSTWAEDEKPTLGVDLDATFVTHYMWRGFDVFDDHGSFQPSVKGYLVSTIIIGLPNCVARLFSPC